MNDQPYYLQVGLREESLYLIESVVLLILFGVSDSLVNPCYLLTPNKKE